MSHSDAANDNYIPDPRLSQAYEEICRGGEELYESLCPSFMELTESAHRYEDDALLGEGALKEVYRTYDRRTRRWVAMARLRRDRGLQYFDLFVREAWLISSLSHPNIISIHDAGVDEEQRPFFTMDLKGDHSLADRLTAPSRDLRELLGVFDKICDAVAYAHAHRVIHLDLKPENIQCDTFGEVLVCDWGLGKRLDEEEAEEGANPPNVRAIEGLTLVGQIKGSPGYMAPEQACADTAKDERTDVYALGCILYAILTGYPPFTGSCDQVLADTKESNVQPPRLRYPDLAIPESLNAVVMKALARNPDDRYQSVARLQQEIHSYLTGYATRAENPGFFREARLFIARNRLPFAISVVAGTMLTVGSVFFVQNLRAQKMKTAAERDRAEQLVSEVGVLSSDYASFQEETAEMRKQIARRLAASARTLKNYGIFEKPVETIEHAEAFVQLALELDPDCEPALRQRLTLYYLQLNYEAALALSRELGDASESPIRGYVQAFPDFNFTSTHRPSVPQLVDLLRKARSIDPNRLNYLERVLAYQHALRPDDTQFDRVVLAYLEYVNELDPGQLSLVYDRAQAALRLTTDQDLTLTAVQRRSVLGMLSFRLLELNVAGTFDFKSLNRLEIDSLDLRDCADIAFGRKVQLPQLKTVYVRPGQFTAGALKGAINSLTSFDVVEISD